MAYPLMLQMPAIVEGIKSGLHVLGKANKAFFELSSKAIELGDISKTVGRSSGIVAGTIVVSFFEPRDVVDTR